MTEPTVTYDTIPIIFFPVIMIFLPMILAVGLPNRVTEAAGQAEVHRWMARLGVGTVVALVVWGVSTYLSVRTPGYPWATFLSWPLFFPLWFGLAMPLIRAKNPGWGLAEQDALGGSGAVRTASLVNRERESPVTRAMWALAIVANAAGTAAIAARGLMPFPMESSAAGDAAAAAAQRLQWQLFLGLSCLGPIGLLWLPQILRSMRSEPEPMDAAGSRELADLYAAQRRRRVLGMFWLNGVAGPLAIAGTFALAVWFPNLGGWWGVVGGVAGSAVGIVGAIFGVRMSAERARIAEVRARLARSHLLDAGGADGEGRVDDDG
jgi:hypothetical protein